jgi:hypothetical protein
LPSAWRVIRYEIAQHVTLLALVDWSKRGVPTKGSFCCFLFSCSVVLVTDFRLRLDHDCPAKAVSKPLSFLLPMSLPIFNFGNRSLVAGSWCRVCLLSANDGPRLGQRFKSFCDCNTLVALLLTLFMPGRVPSAKPQIFYRISATAATVCSARTTGLMTRIRAPRSTRWSGPQSAARSVARTFHRRYLHSTFALARNCP